MKQHILRKNGLISAEQTIKLIQEKVPYYANAGDLYSALIRVSKYYYGRRSTNLTENEMMLYDMLLKHNICPDTAYQYLRLYMVPDNVKERFRNGKLTRKQILSLGMNEVRRSRIQKFLSVVRDGRRLFEELDWRD